MIMQSISVVGAFLILLAFALLQAQRVEAESFPYQLMNFGGGAALLIVAVAELQIGFILLEAAWTALSAFGLFRLFRGSATE
ncbi:MAG: hypothetical protein R3338_04900 [Thermoanaerobaculia bacterium]|nr:hypothetical protein [Thermoanaerobaculia bacterium]